MPKPPSWEELEARRRLKDEVYQRTLSRQAQAATLRGQAARNQADRRQADQEEEESK